MPTRIPDRLHKTTAPNQNDYSSNNHISLPDFGTGADGRESNHVYSSSTTEGFQKRRNFGPGRSRLERRPNIFVIPQRVSKDEPGSSEEKVDNILNKLEEVLDSSDRVYLSPRRRMSRVDHNPYKNSKISTPNILPLAMILPFLLGLGALALAGLGMISKQL